MHESVIIILVALYSLILSHKAEVAERQYSCAKLHNVNVNLIVGTTADAGILHEAKPICKRLITLFLFFIVKAYF